MRTQRRQLPWYKTLRLGDVLRSGSGLLRVVRGIHRFENGDLRSVSFLIKKCSWTGRALTTCNFTDLRLLGFEPVGVRVRLNSDFDKEIAKIAHSDISNPQYDCCDVKGLA